MEDWLEDEKHEKFFKLFQNIFIKKNKEVIEPAFYRTKQKFDNNFPHTKIKYQIETNKSEFLLINFDRTNSFQVINKNNAKVGIKMNYLGLDTPENEYLELPFSQLKTRGLCELLEQFINKGVK